MRIKSDSSCHGPKFASSISSSQTQAIFSSSYSSPSPPYSFCSESSSPCPPSSSTGSTNKSSLSTPTTIKDLCPTPTDIVSLTFDNYRVLGPIEASTLCQCINRITLEPYLGKVIYTSDYDKYLAPFFLLKDYNIFNSISEICISNDKTLLIFSKTYQDLHHYVRNKKKLESGEAKRIFYQIAKITAECHRKGVIIRDLKLRKLVFIDPQRTQLALEAWDDVIVLPDPNNALLNDRHGCPTYVSPEVLSKSNRFYSGKAADCWSLGVILFTILAGRYPFRDSNPCSLFNKIRRADFEVPSDISPSAEFLIRCLLRKDPLGRLTAQDLVHARWFTSDEDYSNPHQFLLVPNLESVNKNLSRSLSQTLDKASWSTPEQVVPESTVTLSGHADDETCVDNDSKIYGLSSDSESSEDD